MRLLMMGTGPFAVPTFESLLESEHEVAAMVTRPVPPPAGRQTASANPMRDTAEARGVPVLAPADVNAGDAQRQLGELAPDLLVVCDFGQILSAETLAIAPLGGINLHASLLPEYRGAAPIHRALLDGRTTTGVTVIHMTPRLDSGPCLVQIATEIEPDEDAVALERRLAQIGVQAVAQALDMLASWDRQSPLGQPQDSAGATRAPRLKKADGQVDWRRPARDIFNQVRALKPWPKTYTQWHQGGEQQPLRIILDRVSVASPDAAPPGEPGELVRVDSDRVMVATGDQPLALERIQPAGKRPMDIAEFLRGHPMRPGQRLGER